MTDLLGCPFCGGNALIEREGNSRQSTIYGCDDCGCRLETGETFNFGTRWNVRSNNANPAARILEHKWFDPKCIECGCQSLVWKDLYEKAVNGRRDFRRAYNEIRFKYNMTKNIPVVTLEMEEAGREYARTHDPSTFAAIFEAMWMAQEKTVQSLKSDLAAWEITGKRLEEAENAETAALRTRLSEAEFCKIPVIRVEVVEDKLSPNAWRVEAFDDDGACFVTVFYGPDAERRARTYAARAFLTPPSKEGEGK